MVFRELAAHSVDHMLSLYFEMYYFVIFAFSRFGFEGGI